MSNNNNSLDEYRIVVAAATYDELDKHDLERRTSTKDLQCSAASSVVDASTVDIDNTHPYLIRYAEIYAEENNTDASTANKAGPTFVNIKSSSNKYTEGDKVVYTGSKGEPGEEAVVTKVEYDADRNPQYTIKITPSMEESANGATDENGETPSNCRDFKTNPTSLFHSLYEGKWKEAEQCLATNPEEARIWVARYAKKESTTGESTDEGNDIRWQLLPLHLYIALGGRGADDKCGETKAPPIKLLNALLLAFPQATQCTDDQSMIPLHSAIRGNSSLAVIEKILENDPASVYRKDSRSRNAFVLAEKVYGKIHKQPVGSEDETRQLRYAHLMSLLSNAATRVATTKSPQPKQKKAQADTGEKKTQLTPTTPLQKLQIENLALRRENAMLHHRAEINGRLLQESPSLCCFVVCCGVFNMKTRSFEYFI